MSKYATRDSVKPVKIEENWHKLANFQLIPPLNVEQQIERFTTAGKDLMKLRGLGVYDFNEAQPLDDSLEDPTRDPDFDLIDAAVAQRDILLRQQSAAADGTLAESQGKKSSEKSVSDKDSKAESRATESQPESKAVEPLPGEGPKK